MSSGGVLAGYLCCLVSGLFFGGNYAPVKKLGDLGDGVFFCVCMTVGIFAFGFIVNACQGFPKFEIEASFGGCLWAAGNLTVVFIVKTLGMGLGLMLWSGSCMLTGWACGVWGILGVEKEHIKHQSLNYFGVALALVALYVASEIEGSEHDSSNISRNRIVQSNIDEDEDEERFLASNDRSSRSNEKKQQKHSFCVGLSIFSGLLYGVNFNPVENLRTSGGKHSGDALDYVFSHFMGIIVFTALAFACHYRYITKRSDTNSYPDVRSETFWPAFISGAMWAVAQTSWFVANKELSMVISFPIISTLPSVVAALIGYLYFGEMHGERNVKLLLVSGGMRILAVLCIAASR